MPVVIGKNEKFKKQVTCRHCGTMYEYWPNEVFTLWEGKDISGGADGARGFKCTGGCGKDVVTERW